MREDIVTVQNLMRRFGERYALANVSLSIPRGIVFGLVGENGAGKTTLIKHLLGLFKAQEGTVRIFGCDPVRWPVEVLSPFGKAFNQNRNISVVFLVLPVIGVLERAGLQERARGLIAGMRSISVARLLIGYMGFRQLTAAPFSVLGTASSLASGSLPVGVGECGPNIPLGDPSACGRS